MERVGQSVLETAVLDRLWVFFGVGDELHEEVL